MKDHNEVAPPLIKETDKATERGNHVHASHGNAMILYVLVSTSNKVKGHGTLIDYVTDLPSFHNCNT